MDVIFHEKQEGLLCAQHCLNALLQGPFFTAVDLAELARQLDEAEQNQLHPDSSTSHKSNNMDESGYFSIQVISKALSIWSLELVPLLRQSPEAEHAKQHPELQRAFICNFRDHWFTIRRLGHQWFDLNSLLPKPKLVSTTYLTIYLAQLQQEGHSIFFVTGDLPECEADQLLSIYPVSEQEMQDSTRKPGCSTAKGDLNNDDEELQLTMAVSQAELDEEDASLQRVLQSTREEELERELQHALELSRSDFQQSTTYDCALEEAIRLSLTPESNETHSQKTAELREAIRAHRQSFLDKLEASKNPKS